MATQFLAWQKTNNKIHPQTASKPIKQGQLCGVKYSSIYSDIVGAHLKAAAK